MTRGSAVLALLALACGDPESPMDPYDFPPTCEAGTTLVEDRFCAACSPGYYCPWGDWPSIQCSDAGGFDHDRDPATPCEFTTNCSPGQRVARGPTNTSDRACEPCPVGTTSETTNATECTPTADRLVLTDLSLGERHTCGLRADGGTVCWGADGFGQSSGSAMRRHEAIAAGRDATCGRIDGGRAIVCDGRSDRSVVADAPSSASFARMALGVETGCGIGMLGGVICWGDDTAGLVSDAPEGVVTTLAVGARTACALLRDGTLTCWGAIEPGVDDPPDGSFVALSMYERAACALTAEGSPVCWGGFTAEPGIVGFSELAVGSAHACVSNAVTTHCWGANEEGETEAPAEGLETLRAGAGHTCGVRSSDGSVVCWGRDDAGQTSGAPSFEPRQDLAIGAEAVCLVDAAGTVGCWGEAARTVTDAAPTGVTALAAEGSAFCALLEDGRPVCWNDDREGLVSGVPDVAMTSIAVGGSLACGLDAARLPHCWGTHAVDVPALEVAAMDVGGGRACGVLAGEWVVSCWGAVGDEPEGATVEPVIAVADAGVGGCAVRTDGDLVCWGEATTSLSFEPEELVMGLGTACGRRGGTVSCSSEILGDRVPEGSLERFDRLAAGRPDLACGRRVDDGSWTCWGSHRWNPR